jgi:hypothetical protein
VHVTRTYRAFGISAIVGDLTALARVLWWKSFRKHANRFRSISNEIMPTLLFTMAPVVLVGPAAVNIIRQRLPVAAAAA